MLWSIQWFNQGKNCDIWASVTAVAHVKQLIILLIGMINLELRHSMNIDEGNDVAEIIKAVQYLIYRYWMKFVF